jgi:hypothetical protein
VSTSSSIQVEGNDSGMDQPMNLWNKPKEFMECGTNRRIYGITQKNLWKNPKFNDWVYGV